MIMFQYKITKFILLNYPKYFLSNYLVYVFQKKNVSNFETYLNYYYKLKLK